jgi:predicted helicase
MKPVTKANGNNDPNDTNETKIHPAEISRNYSGNSVFLTPPSIVDFMIQAIDSILTNYLTIDGGLSDVNNLFLDPAVGTGNFPIQLLTNLSRKLSKLDKYEFQNWILNSFVVNSYGFEIKSDLISCCLDILVKQTEQNTSLTDSELTILTNRLKKNYREQNALQSAEMYQFIFNRSMELRESGAFIIFGNPPYAISSTSKNQWITSLIEDYKLHLNRDGKKALLGLKGLQDDYVKFIRLAQWILHTVDRPGILAFVSNNYFLDGAIFRGMRYHMKQQFDQIYIINLHGDPKKSENDAEDAEDEKDEKDENIFAIQTGICIFFAISKKPSNRKHNSQAQIYYAGIRGSKTKKLAFLAQKFEDITFRQVKDRLDHEFIPIDASQLELEKKYNQFLYFPDIFKKHIVGVQSLHDRLVTHPDKERLESILTKFYDGTYLKQGFQDQKLQTWVKYDGVVFHDARDWKIADGLRGNLTKACVNIIPWQWRGFDRWWVSYDENLITKGSSGYRIMQFLLPQWENKGIVVSRVSRKASGTTSVFLSNTICESHCLEGGSGIGDYVFPLYINKEAAKKSDWNAPKPPIHLNINPKVIKHLREDLNIELDDFISLSFKIESKTAKIPDDTQIDHLIGTTFFYYCYGILWSPAYRAKFKVFLKSSFPRIPFPDKKVNFFNIAVIGQELSELHCLSFEDQVVKTWPQKKFPRSRPTQIKIRNIFYDKGEEKIYFDDKDRNHCFWIGNITEKMWNFDIGGHSQLKMWLTHRKYYALQPNTPHPKKYLFTRGINEDERVVFLKICHSINQTLDKMEILDNIYPFPKKE